MKLTKNNISKAIDNVQDKYSALFDDLILLKNFKSKNFKSKSIFDFQYKLGIQLYKLASLRNEITVQEKKLIDKKQLIKPRWFIHRMRLYRKFKDSVENCIRIGKTLGDAFVWHFYQFNLPELFRHIDHEEIKIPPTGIGGMGELEFIKKNFILNNHFALLHGITNFLKIGDVSFISMDDCLLTSLGEIKTEKKEDGSLMVHLTAINSKGRHFFENINSDAKNEKDIYKGYFNPERFKRQIKKIIAVLKVSKEKNNENQLIYDKYYVKELEDVVDGLKGKVLNMKKVNARLLFVSNRFNYRTFSKRMFAKQNVKAYKRREDEIVKMVNSLYDKENLNHPIQMGSIHFDGKLEPISLIGTCPIFWYPIRPDIIKEIYFQNVFVLSLFNPTELFLNLKKLGLEFSKDEDTGKFYFGKMIGEKRMWIENISYFLSLIKDHLQTEEAVIEAIKGIVSITENQKDASTGVKIMPEIYHISTAYNQDNIK
ncbi:MAG TPA: hypothetical protein VKT28_10775 [Puia sp.]|nr:hypothetical protein [Puia sp.]